VAAEPAPLLTLHGVRKTFGSLRAVDGVDLQVGAGRITGLIGPNGAGKTTLFNLIAGTLTPSAGEIRFRGERIDAVSPDRIFQRGLARTFQVPRPFPLMTVLENLMLVPLRQTGERFWNNWWRANAVTRQERQARDRAMAVLQTCALADKASELAGRLSGGQHKLLELARVLMIEPTLILLDEPAAGVNPALLETLIDRVIALHRSGISFLVVEHNMDLVMSVCDPIVVMMQGRVICEGDAQTVRSDRRVLDAYLGEVPA
jgi:ABC-type branched-subunit amino acid transport system ATPase component